MPEAIYGESDFPNLVKRNNTVTSPPSTTYNCLGWAADRGKDLRWWSPSPPDTPGVFWPDGISAGREIEIFVEALKTVDFEECDDADYEEGFEKIALFSKGKKFTHVARQLDNGSWTSKLGEWFDISHKKLNDVGGKAYGKSVKFMRRPIPR